MRCSMCMLNNPPKKASLLAQKTEKKNNNRNFKIPLPIQSLYCYWIYHSLQLPILLIIIFSLFSILFIIEILLCVFLCWWCLRIFWCMLIWCYVIWWVCWVYWYDVRVVLWLNSVKRGRYLILSVKINLKYNQPQNHTNITNNNKNKQ